MKFNKLLVVILFGTAISFVSSSVLAHKTKYAVTITNITPNLVLTPVLVASHRKGVKIFTLGEEASYELGRIAEGGDIAPMADYLSNNSKVIDVAHSEGLLGPGDSVTVEVSAKRGARYLTVASMFLPTNDGFMALNGVKLPKYNRGSSSFYSPVYDAGTEANDELCANIPGPGPHPVCPGGEAFSEEADSDEGYVHIHGGIHGIGDLVPELYDWRNPAVKITVERIREY